MHGALLRREAGPLLEHGQDVVLGGHRLLRLGLWQGRVAGGLLLGVQKGAGGCWGVRSCKGPLAAGPAGGQGRGGSGPAALGLSDVGWQGGAGAQAGGMHGPGTRYLLHDQATKRSTTGNKTNWSLGQQQHTTQHGLPICASAHLGRLDLSLVLRNQLLRVVQHALGQVDEICNKAGERGVYASW